MFEKKMFFFQNYTFWKVCVTVFFDVMLYFSFKMLLFCVALFSKSELHMRPLRLLLLYMKSITNTRNHGTLLGVIWRIQQHMDNILARDPFFFLSTDCFMLEKYFDSWNWYFEFVRQLCEKKWRFRMKKKYTSLTPHTHTIFIL